MKAALLAAAVLAVALAVAFRPRPLPGPTLIAAPMATATAAAPETSSAAPAVGQPAPKVPAPAPATPDRLETALERLRAAALAGDRAAMALAAKELLDAARPTSIPDERNGAPAWLAAFDLLAERPEELDDAYAALQDGRATPEQLRALQAWVDANSGAWTALLEASAFDEARYPLDFDKGMDMELGHIAKLMKAGRFLDAKARLLEAEGKDSAGIRRVHGRLADSLADEPILISQLVRCLQVREAGCSAESVRSQVRPMLMLDLAAAVQYGLRELPEGTLGTSELRAMATHYFDCMAQLEALLAKPYYEARDGLLALQDRIQHSGPEGEGSRMMMPGVVNLAAAFAAAEAALKPELDPFSGKAFLRRGDVLYSVGKDGVDNGGNPELDLIVR